MGGKHICLFVFYYEAICRTVYKLISYYVIYDKHNLHKNTLNGNYCYVVVIET